ncbi:MAG: hypothetical protein ACI8W7_003060 [Gammaproteobacteria bacterium]|jgi:hypothetical protein
MKLHNLSIAIVLMFSANNVLAIDSAGSFAVKGVGLSKCSAFVEVVKSKETAKLSRYIGWTAGYISASNQHVSKTFDLTPWQNIRTLTLALVNHCDRNADMRFGEAVVRMAASLAADRLNEKSELVAIEHEGKQHYVYQETIRRTQTKLSELGMFTGDSDGEFNDATKQAVTTFQSERKLPATGLPDQKTMFELMRKGK